MGDGKCHKTTPKGPFMDSDLVSCTKKKPAHHAGGGLKWAGVPPPLPTPAAPRKSKRCKALIAKCKKSACKVGLAGSPSKGMVTLGCTGTKTTLLDYFNMAAACPPLCMKGPHGHHECLDGDTMAMFKHQITSMPSFKALGPKVAFSTQKGKVGTVCNMVKSLAHGLGF